MKAMWIFLALFSLASPIYAGTTDAALDDIAVNMKGVLGALTVIDESDKKIKQSNDDQQWVTDQIKKIEAKVERDTPVVMMDARRADEMRQEMLDLGCPEHGGAVSHDLYLQCEPLRLKHIEFAKKVLARANEIKESKAKIADLRKSVSDTLLKNIAQQKKNNEERSRQTQILLQLQVQAVTIAARQKIKAGQACSGIRDIEVQVCCHNVVFDGKDPKLCNVELICQTYKTSGLFGSAEIICTASNRP